MNPGHYRRKIGQFEAIALHDGVVMRDRPPGFVRNASDDEVGAAFAEAGMDRDKLTITFTALAVQTPGGLVLIDTGFGESGPPTTGNIRANLEAAGHQPGDVKHVIISHFHGDHILGLRRADGALAFPNARIHVPQKEWDFWMDDAKMAASPGLKDGFETVRRILGPQETPIERFAWGEEILPGFTSVEAEGHTPGMSAIEIASDGAKLLFVADITNNPLIFVRHPEWQAVFDIEPDKAVATRRRILGRAATERLPVFYFHAPFPALGTIIKTGDVFQYLPALWTP